MSGKQKKLACNHCAEPLKDSKAQCPIKDCDAVFCANGKCQLTKWSMCRAHTWTYEHDGNEEFEAPCVDCGTKCSSARDKCENDEECPRAICRMCPGKHLCGRCAKLSEHCVK